ncbi:MAG: S1 RNA-binding domain-containing protein, partial [Kosmotogaceae bacterium]|nr:S1 RNA-binding domain-containing protein [Kosmotogaceae bacterium]
MDQNDVVKNTGDQESQEEPTNKMEALLAQEGLTIDFPKRGETRKGTIASISDTQILVSVGAKSEGILTGKELDSIAEETRKSLEVGEEIAVYIINPEDANGNLILSYTRALEEENWQKAEELLESEDSFNSKIEGFNKGGLLVPLGTIRGFVPASQIGLSRRLTLTGNSPEERYAEMVGEEIEVCVIEVDRDRRRLILSERAASSDTRDTIKERVIDELEEGEIRTGRVTSLADFGAFVNINGADGLVHLSELSWEHVNHPSEILEVGQEIKVKIISVDVDRKRIGLSIRRLEDDPWNEQVEDLTEGQLVEGKITRLTNFGAFARLVFEDQDKDLEGLIHISEISERRIEHPKEVLHEGDVVTLRVIKIEEDTHRIGLSLRRVDSPAYTDLDWKTMTEELDVSDLSGELEEEAPKEEALEPQIEEETAAPTAEVEIEEIVTEEPETEETVAEAETEEIDAEEPLVASEAEEIEVEEPVAELETEEVETEEPLVESEAEEIEAEEPVAEIETEEAETEEPL